MKSKLQRKFPMGLFIYFKFLYGIPQSLFLYSSKGKRVPSLFKNSRFFVISELTESELYFEYYFDTPTQKK